MDKNVEKMTYPQIRKSLTFCEKKLEELRNQNSSDSRVKVETKKFTMLKESLEKRLKESDKGVIFTDDERKAQDLASKGSNVKLTSEQEGMEFSKSETTAIAKEVGKGLARALRSAGDEIDSMKVTDIEPNSFELKVTYKNDSEDQFSFYIEEDTLHLVDFSFDKPLIDVGVKPSGQPIVHVEVLTNELLKHFKSLQESMSDQEFADAQEKERLNKHPEKNTIAKIKALLDKEKKAEMDENESHDQGGDLDIGHQDDEPDMLKQTVYDIATYAAKLYKQLDKYDKMDAEVDFPNWWQSKVILAKDYIGKAQHYLEFEDKQPALDQLALEGKINERININPEAEKTVVRFIRSLAKKYGYGEQDAAFLIKQVLTNQGLDEASAEEEEKFHKKLDTLVHKTFGKGEHEKDESVNEASVEKLQKKHGEVVGKMKELAKLYKAGDKSVVSQLKDLTQEKKSLEAQIEKKASSIGVGQEYDDSVEESKKKLTEAKATCCGKCGRVHVKGTECKRPFLKGKDHCRFN